METLALDEARFNLEEEFEICLRSRFPLVCIVSHEEIRIQEQIKRVCEKRNTTLMTWDHADFFQKISGDHTSLPSAGDPLSALEAIEKMDGSVVFMLRDFHQCWNQAPRIIRKLRNLAHSLKFTKKTILVTTPTNCTPLELKDDMVQLEYSQPDYNDLVKILKNLLAIPGTKMNLEKPDADRLIRAALGLSANQAQRIFAKAIVTDGVLQEKDIDMVNNEKKQIIRESGALEFYTPKETIADVGGLEVLKEWLSMRERAFSKKARDYGLPEPKGIALIGIPGTGKSLTAKMISGLWRLPLIRMDIGALFGSLVGQSEENTRKALHLAETIAPCVLWIDEIEKGLSTGEGDGGTSMRVFGSILSWMQEKKKPVFVVATANNISKLPPELLRRGRFDELFFLDLPTATERTEIFKVHIQKRKRDPKDYDLDRIVAASEGYVGAEIEQAIIDAMYLAFNDTQKPARPFTTDDIITAINKLVPMSRSQKEVIGDLRRWLTEGRAQSASFKESTQAEKTFVPIDLTS